MDVVIRTWAWLATRRTVAAILNTQQTRYLSSGVVPRAPGPRRAVLLESIQVWHADG